MEFYLMVTHILIVMLFGNSIIPISGGLLDGLTSIVGQNPQNYENQNPLPMINPMMNAGIRTDVDTNNFFNDKQRDQNNVRAMNWQNQYNRPNNNLNQYNRPNLSQRPQIRPQPSTINTKQEEEEAAKQFPGLTSILEKLKEANRLKEEQKKAQENNSDNGIGTKPNDDNTKDDDKHNNHNANDWQYKPMKSLTKKKFYFQAQPVLPEYDAVKLKKNETVYYSDGK